MQPKTQGSLPHTTLVPNRRAFIPGGAEHQQFPSCLQKPVAEAKFQQELPRPGPLPSSAQIEALPWDNAVKNIGAPVSSPCPSLRDEASTVGEASHGDLRLLPIPSTQLLRWGCHLKANTPEHRRRTENSNSPPKETDFICHRVWRKCSSLRALSKTVELVKGNWEEPGRFTEDTG